MLGPHTDTHAEEEKQDLEYCYVLSGLLFSPGIKVLTQIFFFFLRQPFLESSNENGDEGLGGMASGK